MSYKFCPTDRYSDYHTGRGILEWRSGKGYTHTSMNPVTRHFTSINARTGWIRKMNARVDDNWSLAYEIDKTNPLVITAWMEEIL